MRVKHILLTMFNRRQRPTSFFQPGLELDEEWLRYRWNLFTTYTIPSVAAQSYSDFDWVILCNERSPAWLRERTAALRLPCRLRFSFKKRDPALADLADPSYDVILTTRIDSDDAWHCRAMERIRQAFDDDPCSSEILNFGTGYRYDTLSQRVLRVQLASPPFSTKINFAPVDDPLDIGGAHDKLLQKYICRDISQGEPMFLQVIHGENVRDRLDSRAGYMPTAQSRTIMHRDFNIDVPRDGRGLQCNTTSTSQGAPSARANHPALSAQPSAVRVVGGSDAAACKVAVSIPYFQCKRSVRRAVESILGQTHRNLALVVVNDGDTDAPWDQLAHIDDPRLVRFNLPGNHGRYFADAVVLRAIDAPYFMIQDADDWSDPQRIARLLDVIRREHADGAISAHYEYPSSKTGSRRKVRFTDMHESLTYQYRQGIALKLRSTHFGLFKTSALRRIGGYYGGFRIGYDTLLIHLLMMTGYLAYLDVPLYHRTMRATSLSHSPATGMGSAVRMRTTAQLEQLYVEAVQLYIEYLAGAIDKAMLCSQIRQICGRHITHKDRRDLRTAASELNAHLQTAHLVDGKPAWPGSIHP